jgi:Relaxase/Mobilisation nuclease domain
MIAKGNLHGHGRTLARYLVTGKDGERAELVELRGFAGDDLRAAFLDVEIQARGTQATKPFFHAYVRLPASETLGRAQWRHVADRIEKQLGFVGQPRAIAFHHLPDGAAHMHVAWSRIDLEDMCAIDPGLYKNRLKEISRELECELGLTQVSNERAAGNRTFAPGRNEFEQARRLGTDLKAIRNAIRECWEQSDNGRSFIAVLDAQGLILARGDKRDFVVVDHAGGGHALSKRITRATISATRGRLADIERRQLPSVAEAKAMQHDRARMMPGSVLQRIAPIPGRGIGEYPAPRNNAPAATATRPIVSFGPELPGAPENSSPTPARELSEKTRAPAAPPAFARAGLAVQTQKRPAASSAPGQQRAAPPARPRGPEPRASGGIFIIGDAGTVTMPGRMFDANDRGRERER